MLVLTRREGEKIKVGEMITITVVRVVGTDRVRIGIEAPNDVPIDRLEIAEAKKSGFSNLPNRSENRIQSNFQRSDSRRLGTARR